MLSHKCRNITLHLSCDTNKHTSNYRSCSTTQSSCCLVSAHPTLSECLSELCPSGFFCAGRHAVTGLASQAYKEMNVIFYLLFLQVETPSCMSCTEGSARLRTVVRWWLRTHTVACKAGLVGTQLTSRATHACRQITTR